ncbi:hypothetical protein COCON_G00074870 [Conger conger]|uniref:Uncharacterized protein n=1 Tax=Conger conger TaxID=82655 RepID=A0A9Q1I240_CONCO|nr:hypothetical protein COCON_G00074870 [Conger conger]
MKICILPALHSIWQGTPDLRKWFSNLTLGAEQGLTAVLCWTAILKSPRARPLRSLVLSNRSSKSRQNGEAMLSITTSRTWRQGVGTAG